MLTGHLDILFCEVTFINFAYFYWVFSCLLVVGILFIF